MTVFLSRFAALLLILSVALPAVSSAVQAQGIEHVKSHYTKYEFKIPMRDGKRLFTAVYVPKDAAQKDTAQKYPILYSRTPYSVKPYGADQYRTDLGPSGLFGKEGYIFAYQDVRGRWMSEGEFVNMRPTLARHDGKEIDESTDTYDTIAWLLKRLENLHNGKVGMWGISYPGFYTSAGIIDAHPALKAASPQAPIADWFVGDDWHHNGALILPHAFNFMSVFGRPRPQPTKKFEHKFDHEMPDGYQFFLQMGTLADADPRHFKGDVAFWNEIMRHPTYDEFWKSRNLRPHLKEIKPAVMTVGGWFDAENLFGALETYKRIESSSPGITNWLVMGPWNHGGWSRSEGEAFGHVPFNSKTSVFYREHIELPFFEFHLKGKGDFKQPEAWVFETGTNEWNKFDAWPPKTAQPAALYLLPGGRLGLAAPEKVEKDDAFDEYVSDPAKPVPYMERTDTKMVPEHMIDDQRFASRRTDVLVYQTDVLEEDVTLAGILKAELFVSTSGTDSDWIVKLVDVYPDDYPDPNPNPTGVRMGGFQQLVRGEVMRGKFRNSYEKPEAFQPGEPTAVKFALQDICHTFRSGHRIQVQVQSTWFPLVDRNPQRFVDIYAAQASDFKKATQRVYHTREMPSRISVLKLP